MRRFLFATGGTGGHVYPALAVAERLRERGHEVRFVGRRDGPEAELVRGAGYEFHGVSAGKLDRQRPDPRQLRAALAGPEQARRVARRLAPDLAVGFGGFASFPGSAGALLAGVPLVLHEQNAFPGLANRLLAPFARLVIVSHDEARARLRARRFAHAPYPVREERVPKREARRALGLPEEGLVTLVMGGSQGSVALNEGVVTALRELRDLRPLVLHSTGPAHLEAVRAAAAGLANHLPRPYVDATLAWSAADLAITRAGSGTLAEAAYHGVPLIMVPLPTAAEDHQLHNARAVESAGAGVVLEQHDLGDLAALWRERLAPERLRPAAAAALARSPAGAAARFADLLTELTTRPARGSAPRETT